MTVEQGPKRLRCRLGTGGVDAGYRILNVVSRPEAASLTGAEALSALGR